MQKANNKIKRKYRSSPLSSLLPPTVSKALRRFGFAQTSIVSNWGKIIGADMEHHTAPTKLTFKKGTRDNGTLHVMVDGAEALRLQHQLPLIIEKINMFHGFKLVGHIAITQGPVASRRDQEIEAKEKPLPVLEEGEQTHLDDILKDTKSEGLKDVLSRLGRRVLGDKKK